MLAPCIRSGNIQVCAPTLDFSKINIGVMEKGEYCEGGIETHELIKMINKLADIEPNILMMPVCLKTQLILGRKECVEHSKAVGLPTLYEVLELARKALSLPTPANNKEFLEALREAKEGIEKVLGMISGKGAEEQ